MNNFIRLKFKSCFDLDITEKVDLILKPPTEEVVTQDELVELFKTNSSPKHYIGLEISGFLHLGSLISTGFKINDFTKAGVKCKIFLADWHTLINDKLGGDWETISKVSKYYQDAFKLVCPDAEIVLGSKLYEEKIEYWSELVKFTKHMSIARTMRTLTIMGRSEDDKKIDVAKLLYPAMQAVDIHSLDVDIAHAGMDQRTAHVLAREIYPKMGWKKPVAVHHHLLPGLLKPVKMIGKEGALASKMSKSKPKTAIFIHDSEEEISKKIKEAWCPQKITKGNPVFELAEYVVFHEKKTLLIERPEKYGGDIELSLEELKKQYEKGAIHPLDLKKAVAKEVNEVIKPLRVHFEKHPEFLEVYKKAEITR